MARAMVAGNLDLAEAVAARGGSDGGLGDCSTVLCRGCRGARWATRSPAPARARVASGRARWVWVSGERNSGDDVGARARGPVAARGWAWKCYHASTAGP